MSDGTSILYFLDPENFTEIGRIQVRDGNGTIKHLNELEYINGEIYANIWQTEQIVRINPQTGKVTARIDLTGLLGNTEYQPPADVLNGIAYDAEKSRLFVTGKLWPSLFEIRIEQVTK
jgi:glutamine cyclotransferase